MPSTNMSFSLIGVTRGAVPNEDALAGYNDFKEHTSFTMVSPVIVQRTTLFVAADRVYFASNMGRLAFIHS